MESLWKTLTEQWYAKGRYSTLQELSREDEEFAPTALSLDSRKTSLKVSSLFCRAFDSVAFKIAIGTGWRLRRQKINLLELEAALLAVRHMQRSALTRGARVHFLIDNFAVLGALGKGWSSSRALNRLCRRLAAEKIHGDVALLLYWVPSHLNPADARRGPSRCQSLARPAHLLLRNELGAINFLRKAKKKENTVRDYKRATLCFAHWLEEQYPYCKPVTELDRRLAEYGCQLLTANPKRGQHQKFLCTLYSIEFFMPENSHQLQCAWQASHGWTRQQPPKSPPPLPR